MNAWQAVGVGEPFEGLCASTISPDFYSVCADDPYVYASFWMNAFPGIAQIVWDIPWGVNYTLSNNNRQITITGIDYPYPDVYTISATVSGNGVSITRFASLNVEDCGGMYKLKSVKIIEGVTTNGFSVNVFPNPVSDVLTVNLNNKEPDVDCEIELTDIKGVVVRKLTTKNSSTNLNTLNLLDGLYLLRIKYKNKDTISKVIVTHKN